MRQDRPGVVNRGCELPELLRSCERVTVIAVGGEIDNLSVKRVILSFRKSFAPGGCQRSGKRIRHRRHVATSMPGDMTSRIQQADFDGWIVVLAGARPSKRDFDPTTVFLEQGKRKPERGG